MKLLYNIAGTYRPAGMERVLTNKANWFAAHGYEVVIVTTDQKGREPYFELDPANPGNTFMIYYLQKDGSAGTPIVTTGHGQSGADFTIRCVRDAPQGTRSYDSSYSSGGTGFGL